MIEECGIYAVRGPWPCAPDEVIDIPPSRRSELGWAQGAAGITRDGILGPQTWAVLSKMQDDRDEADFGHLRLPLEWWKR